jgi:hypothetical protein
MYLYHIKRCLDANARVTGKKVMVGP